ncbi:pyruvate formate-lyase-activating protein [Hydrogenoanaerobacterium sp.]|uniref:pyruvate formate-lyase-activating protein n=1 Tax=Hydrogenoanaerobacterium sp. TaxID=2953763 RepID=UPI002897E085|nr:pyruvate formate-lyase-activating protein [Hydrogenoanaerobacterium sp.]
MMEQAVTGRIHSIETFGAVDGPGVRYVLFLQGCRMKCLFCHNPDTWECGGGRLISSEEVIEDIKSYRNFIKNGGVTISGGEPLLQPEFVLDIINRCKGLGFHTAIDTAGSQDLAVSQPVIDAADLILLDIKALEPQVCVELTGMDNRHELKTLDYCQRTAKPVWIRHVLLPGYTLDRDRLTKLADFLKPYSCIEKVELLPFHKMGEFKWKELGMEYQLYDTPVPTREEIQMATEIFKSRGLPL